MYSYFSYKWVDFLIAIKADKFARMQVRTRCKGWYFPHNVRLSRRSYKQDIYYMPNTFQIWKKQQAKFIETIRALIVYEMYAENSFLQSAISINLKKLNATH